MHILPKTTLSGLMVLLLAGCNLGATPKPPTDTFPVIDVQNPTENFLGSDNVEINHHVDPKYYLAGDVIEALWYPNVVTSAAVSPVASDGTFSLKLTVDKIDTTTPGFKVWTGSKTELNAYVLRYGTSKQNVVWVEGDVHLGQKPEDYKAKYNVVMYATEDQSLVENVKDDPVLTQGITISVKLKKGFNKVYVQETHRRRLVTTSVNYTAPHFTSNQNP